MVCRKIRTQVHQPDLSELLDESAREALLDVACGMADLPA